MLMRSDRPSTDAKPPLGDDLRLIDGLLRTPYRGRLVARTSETAIPVSGVGEGWIERALFDMSPDPAEAPGRILDVVESITSQRVGGRFWAPGLNWPAGVQVVVQADDPAQLRERVAFALEIAAPAEIGVLLPDKAWARPQGRSLADRGISWAAGDHDPWAILDQGRSVVVGGDDELGLLALVAGHKVYCRTPGYLAGWGVTVDRADIPLRGRRQAWQIAAAALLIGTRYFDPFTGRVTSCEAIIDQLATWRRVVDEDRDLACCAGIALWKRDRIRGFLAPGARDVPVLRDARRCVATAKATGGAIAVWPSRAPAGLADLAEAEGTPLRQVEDGFIRSVGLGSDLLPPCSIVVDQRGVYYDPNRPSDLEVILTETQFTPALRQRARALIDILVARGLTKYNTGGGGFARPARRRVVLVTGQVEDDQSMLHGGGGCTGNLDLLRRVRAHESDAYILYKPHPDVEAGNRVGVVPDSEALLYANQVIRDVATPALLGSVDAVHVLTSLTGFEALLREREVVVHGEPFYSGWGLTRDLKPPPRRGRKLSLAELVAGTLILYPRYLDPVTGLLCPPEVLVDRLANRTPESRVATVGLRMLRRATERMGVLTAKASPLRAQPHHD